LLAQSQLDIFHDKALGFLSKQKYELNEKGQQERELTTEQVGPSLTRFAKELLLNQLIVRYDGHLPARPLISSGMTFLPDAQVTFHSQKVLAIEVKIIREQDPSGSLAKAIGQTLMYRALGFECALGLVFDLRKKKHESLASTLSTIGGTRRTNFILFT
jgi:hypothetical protein